MSKLILEQETHRILGACFEVYKEKGCGFVEPVYQECLELELARQSIEFLAQQEMGLSYKGVPLRQTYRADFICFGKVIVEIKAVSALTDEHRAQLMNYLRATGLKVGLLINFSHYPGVEHERFVI
ncbi:MAG TPA: GxxExxY protein [Verrucomicrobiae bacterium]